tara:strand:+ start:422 stop:634 length:213 start_codon:yes stop_codon:yes gene_type:complete
MEVLHYDINEDIDKLVEYKDIYQRQIANFYSLIDKNKQHITIIENKIREIQSQPKNSHEGEFPFAPPKHK